MRLDLMLDIFQTTAHEFRKSEPRFCLEFVQATGNTLFLETKSSSNANRISLRPKMLATPAHPPEFHTEQLEENYRT